MSVHILGIRHHGPGSARSVRAALEELQPDAILVEGPPDADEQLALAAHAQMRPPVALLIYLPDEPQRAVYYPFAEFSPEWQAIRYGLARRIPVRFIDLPQSQQYALPRQITDADEIIHDDATPAVRRDPLRWVGEAAGYSDGELWWEHMIEQRRDGTELFRAIMELMTALREEATHASKSSETTNAREDSETTTANDASEATETHESSEATNVGEPSDVTKTREASEATEVGESSETTKLNEASIESEASEPSEVMKPRESVHDALEALREAHMRKSIRAAEREGFERIAVVCGAWHAPALERMPPASEDAALLKGLPKVKVHATWVAWTMGRLTYRSGYGAGVESPEYYQHLWSAPDNVNAQWMIRAARLLREQDLDASSASVIEAARLADALAAMRGRPVAGLPELGDAARAVFCSGDDAPMRLINEKLIVGERMGEVPEETPLLPLQQDLRREQKRLRLPPEASERVLDLDLRKANDLERSRLLHRLRLLGVGWGAPERASGKGTFREVWRLRWQPEFALAIIEANIWGNTVITAADAHARHLSAQTEELPALTALVERALLADLPEAINDIMQRLESVAALSGDIPHAMDALPPLANVMRYGNVRQTGAGVVRGVIDGLVTRICIGLPNACSSLNDEAAEAMYARLSAVHGAITLLQSAEHADAWHAVLRRLPEQKNLHGLIAGRCCRLLLDEGLTDAETTGRSMNLALSTGVEPAQASAWAEGFLRGSGLVLLHNEELWRILDAWIASLKPEAFTQLLPLLRRTFSTFTAPERRRIGEHARRATDGNSPASARSSTPGVGVATERARRVLPLAAQLLGLSYPPLTTQEARDE